MDKRHYSAFSGTDLDIRLRERGITELCLTGVCTDICVLHTAVDAYNLGYQLMIPERAVASFDEQGHEWALRHFKQTLEQPFYKKTGQSDLSIFKNPVNNAKANLTMDKVGFYSF